VIGLLIALYSGPASDPADWQKLLASDSTVPMAVIINPDNGPGRHLFKDYLSPIQQLNSAGAETLGYIPTRNGRMPLGKVRKELYTYFHDYHVNGVFLDEMPDQANKRNLRYYQRVTKLIWKLHPGAHIFGNPGTAFSRAFLSTGIQTFVEEEDTGKNVLSASPSSWTGSLPSKSFAEIAYSTPDSLLPQVESALLGRNLYWTYITDGKGSNPYAALPSYWNQEVSWVQSQNANTGNRHIPVLHPTLGPGVH